MEVKLVKSESDLRKVGKLLLQLRSNYDLHNLVDQIKLQQQKGYEVAFIEKDTELICVAGFLIGIKLAWGKHLYVDDLVTDEHNRSTGAGRIMMNWLKSYAKDNGCSQIHLDSGVQKFLAHRFYLRENFNIASHHFSITDLRC